MYIVIEKYDLAREKQLEKLADELMFDLGIEGIFNYYAVLSKLKEAREIDKTLTTNTSDVPTNTFNTIGDAIKQDV